MAELLEVDAVKFKTLFEIRWLSMGKCIEALLRNYEPLMVILTQEANKGNPTSIGLLQQMSSYQYCALLHLVGDILAATNHLSRLFQYRDVCFSAVRSAVSYVKH